MSGWRASFLCSAVALGAAADAIAQDLFLRRQHATGDAPVAVAAGDLDEDGLPDLVTANANDGTVSILLGAVGGSFAPQVTYATGGNPVSLALTDLVGDSAPDLLVADPTTVTVHENEGDGTFGAAMHYPAGDGIRGMAVADLDGDGTTDVAVVSNSVAVLFNQGDGSFGPPVVLPITGDLCCVAAGDLDTSGSADLAVGDAAQSAIFTLQNDGSGNFSHPSLHPTSAPVLALTIADVDGDGTGDLVATSTADAASVSLSLGNGSFAPETTFPTLPGPDSIAARDIDGDQACDIVIGHSASNSIAVLRNSGSGSGNFAPRTDVPAGSSPTALALADFDGEGTIDIAVAHQTIDSASVLLNDGAGDFELSAYRFNDRPGPVVVQDLNADGAADMVVPLDSSLAILINDGRGAFSETHYPIAGFPLIATTADVNRDGLPDVLAVNGFSIATLINRGHGNFSGPTLPQPYFRNFLAMVAADLDGDGEPDLAMATLSQVGVGWLTVVLNEGGGTFGAAQQYGVTAFPDAMVHGDMDDDGDVDIVMGNLLFRNAGDGTFTEQTFAGTGVRAAADLNRDGFPDLVATDSNSRMLRVLENDGTGTFSTKSYPVPTRLWNASIADLDGDTRPDVIATNVDDDAVSVLMNLGEGTLGQHTRYGSAGRAAAAIAIADINVDGTMDIVAAHYQSQRLSFLLGQREAACQPDLGFQGPGTATAALCGLGLLQGEASLYAVQGTAANAPGALLLSAAWQPNATLFPNANPSLLLSGTALAIAVPIGADALGEFAVSVPGATTVADVILQSLFLDPDVAPHGVATTNAVLARFGR